METNFGVTSKYFFLYEAFKKEAEKRGVTYIESLVKYSEENFKSRNCLYFAKNWDGKLLGMSISNCNHPIDLDTNFVGAIAALELFVSKVKLTKSEIEQILGYSIDIIE